ncbi:hypothetical protein OHA25_20680 [Nonomuraea sp. NBC_00507]|uniref:hypothetical protein n=1 Tax=Nonomuraea sp. NBC_00507 TaxID=2976002 RepID=UPI002E17CEF6
MVSTSSELRIGEGTAKVISVSLPEGTVNALKKVAGSRGLSAMVASVLERELRHLLLRAEIDDYQREHGAFTEEEREAARALFDEATRRVAR